ncbi:hypothetical protein XELAEV_18007228mg, partial [Xenopus laevis]
MLIFYLALLPWAFLIAGIYGQSINQTQLSRFITAGEHVHLECTYKVSYVPYVFWYIQYPGKAPEMLLSDLTQKTHKGFSALHNKKETSYHMTKDRAELEDSGVYFCAVSDTVTKGDISPITQ